MLPSITPVGVIEIDRSWRLLPPHAKVAARNNEAERVAKIGAQDFVMAVSVGV
jgi:hypothetical protein